MSIFSHRKRAFLNSISTGHTSYIFTDDDSRRGREYKWRIYMLTTADCRRRIQLEFFLGTKLARRRSLQKINLLIDVLTRFRDALIKERDLIEKGESRGPKRAKKA